MFEDLYCAVFSMKCLLCGERFFWADSFRYHGENHLVTEIIGKLRASPASTLTGMADKLRDMADRLDRGL